MAAELLHCCICPKRPNFSDASHLLTHVSSKGHLAHLHKLQVRSHQEETAGQRLAVYNQWFVDHNVAHLLSERMQQKEQKQAKRRAENKQRCATAKKRPQPEIDPILNANDDFSDMQSYGNHTSVTNSFDDWKPDRSFANVLSPSYPPFQHAQPSPLKHRLENMESLYLEGENPLERSSQITQWSDDTIPEMARLKGVIWPGMDIFDSASQETQRKRNQRKDVSVLERMQSMSELVEPMETVCSPGGTMKKRRHMDELEDDSPVEGESPLLKQSSKRKRKAPANISKIVPRSSFRRTRAARLSTGNIVTPTKDSLPMQRLPRAPRQHQQSAVDSVIDSKVSGYNAPKFYNRRHFPILEDDQVYSTTNQTFPNPFHHDSQSQNIPKPLLLPSVSWSQPLQQTVPSFDLFQEYELSHVATKSYDEDFNDRGNVNPLTWQRGSYVVPYSPEFPTFSTFDEFESSLGALADVYAFTKNPLADTTPLGVPLNGNSRNVLAAREQHVDQTTPIRS